MRIKVHFWYYNASTIVLTIECYRIKAVFHFNHTVAKRTVFHCFKRTHASRTNHMDSKRLRGW